MTAIASFVCPTHFQLEVNKALYQIDFFARSIQLEGWYSATQLEDWRHDVGVMRAFDDLQHLRLELLDAHATVLHEFQITFGHQPTAARDLVDVAQGVEVVVLSALQRRQVKSFRLVVNYRGRDRAYQSLLKMNWGTAATLPRGAQSAYESEHARKITGGRCQGGVRVADSARHRLRIVSAGGRGFAFGDSDEEDGLKGVFCHQRFAPQGFVFQLGRTIQAIVVQSPRGLQARGIEAV